MLALRRPFVNNTLNADQRLAVEALLAPINITASEIPFLLTGWVFAAAPVTSVWNRRVRVFAGFVVGIVVFVVVVVIVVVVAVVAVVMGVCGSSATSAPSSRAMCCDLL